MSETSDIQSWLNRASISRSRLLEVLLVVFVPIVLLSIPVLINEQSLGAFYVDLFNVTIGTTEGWTLTLLKTIPVFITGLGVLIAFRTGVWNIGAEGQMAIGAVTGMAIAFSGLNLPAPVMIFLVIIGAFLAGGLYGAIAGVLKAQFDVNEILTTLMLNFVALLLVEYGANNVWASQQGYPFSRAVPSSYQLPRLFGTDLHVGIFLLVILFPLVWFLLYKSPLGFEFRTAGSDMEVARYGGMSARKAIVVSILISGGIAGIAGAVELLGVIGRLQDGITGPYYGYLGLMAALLAGNRLRYLPLTALFFGAILAAQVSLQVSVSLGIEQLITGMVLLGVIALNR
jgi:simple sugar transport system permease protein